VFSPSAPVRRVCAGRPQRPVSSASDALRSGAHPSGTDKRETDVEVCGRVNSTCNDDAVAPWERERRSLPIPCQCAMQRVACRASARLLPCHGYSRMPKRTVFYSRIGLVLFSVLSARSQAPLVVMMRLRATAG
jgi:hypothetical protein